VDGDAGGQERSRMSDYFEVKRNPNLIEIPEGATNGEVFEKLIREAYSKTLFIWGKDESNNTIYPIMSEEWWNSPYRKEQK